MDKTVYHSDDKLVYICTGSCKAEISEEQFKNGLTKCGTESCTLYGRDFKKMTKCSKCGQVYSEKNLHNH
jgi:hypothetical protein